MWRSSRAAATEIKDSAPFAAISGKVDSVDGVDAVDGELAWCPPLAASAQAATASAVAGLAAINATRRGSLRSQSGSLCWRR